MADRARLRPALGDLVGVRVMTICCRSCGQRSPYRQVGPYCAYCNRFYATTELQPLARHKRVKPEGEMRLGEDVGRCPSNHDCTYVMEGR